MTASHFMRGEGQVVHPRLPAQVGLTSIARNPHGRAKGEPEVLDRSIKQGMVLFRSPAVPEA